MEAYFAEFFQSLTQRTVSSCPYNWCSGTIERTEGPNHEKKYCRVIAKKNNRGDPKHPFNDPKPAHHLDFGSPIRFPSLILLPIYLELMNLFV